MNLQKSREIIILNVKEAGNKMPPDVKMALIIAAEAEDYVLEIRHNINTPYPELLPNETVD